MNQEKLLEQTLAIMASLEADETAGSEPDLWGLSISHRGLEIMQRWNGNSWSNNRLETVYLTYDEAMAVSLEMAKEP